LDIVTVLVTLKLLVFNITVKHEYEDMASHRNKAT